MSFANRLTKPPSEDKQLEYNLEEEWTRYESGYYSHDYNHSGCIFVSQRMVDKYNLDKETIEDWYKDEVESMYDEEDEDHLAWLKETKEKWAQVIHIHHCGGWSKDSKEGWGEPDTPHGEIWSEEFVAWFNDFPLELLRESCEDVDVASWCDG